ncbi:MAG: hypothetical protein ACMXYG_00310 [Candidatus Woesearchaeota archaeon]
MAKFAEAEARLMKNIFVCRKTKKKIRADPLKVIAGKVRARGGSKTLRPKRKK